MFCYFEAVMCDRYGWESVFYMSGLVGIGWSLLWAVFGASCPNSSRFISSEEKEAIARSLAGTVRDRVRI